MHTLYIYDNNLQFVLSDWSNSVKLTPCDDACTLRVVGYVGCLRAGTAAVQERTAETLLLCVTHTQCDVCEQRGLWRLCCYVWHTHCVRCVSRLGLAHNINYIYRNHTSRIILSTGALRTAEHPHPQLAHTCLALHALHLTLLDPKQRNCLHSAPYANTRHKPLTKACLPADTPWDMVTATRRSSGVAPRACVRVYARVLVPPNLYIRIYRPTAVKPR